MKLRYIETHYKVDEENKVVVAKSSFVINDGEISLTTITAQGIAMAKTEEFNPEIGKKVARARAEKAAYIKYRDFLKDRLKMIEKLKRVSEIEYNKVLNYIEHQKEYIKSF